MKKIPLLIAAAAGYVLGTRAGRARYEQIRTQANKVWENPKVQEAVDEVQTQAKQAGADVTHKVGSKVAEAASDVASTVAAKVKKSDDVVVEEDELGPLPPKVQAPQAL